MAKAHVLLSASLGLLALASAAAPQPPCAAPKGIIPAVPECMCSTDLAHHKGIAIRQYGVPTTEVLVSDLTPPNFDFGEVLNISAANIFLYLQIANSKGEDILASRTAPITVRPPQSGNPWFVSMMVSTAHFPDPAKVPTPKNFEMSLSPVGQRVFAALAFNTSALPSEAQFKAKCAELAQGLPKGYSIVNDGWSPAYVLYSPQKAELWTNECWQQVKAA